MNTVNFKPQGSYVVIELPKPTEKTEGGIYKPQETIAKERENTSVDYLQVLATGPDCTIVKPGDYIFTGVRITSYNMEGEEFGIIQESFIVGIKNK